MTDSYLVKNFDKLLKKKKIKKKLNSPTFLIDEEKTITNTLISFSQKFVQIYKTKSHPLKNIIRTTS